MIGNKNQNRRSQMPQYQSQRCTNQPQNHSFIIYIFLNLFSGSTYTGKHSVLSDFFRNGNIKAVFNTKNRGNDNDNDNHHTSGTQRCQGVVFDNTSLQLN